MKDRVLVAGIGNVFLADDGFGVEVARRLARTRLPEGARVEDFGIRGLHLAYELAEQRELVILVDAVRRGGAPGTVSVLEVDVSQPGTAATSGAHVLDLATVFAWAAALGGVRARVLLVGCEPLTVAEGEGLSPPVREAVAYAADAVLKLVRQSEPGARDAPAEGVA